VCELLVWSAFPQFELVCFSAVCDRVMTSFNKAAQFQKKSIGTIIGKYMSKMLMLKCENAKMRALT